MRLLVLLDFGKSVSRGPGHDRTAGVEIEIATEGLARLHRGPEARRVEIEPGAADGLDRLVIEGPASTHGIGARVAPGEIEVRRPCIDEFSIGDRAPFGAHRAFGRQHHDGDIAGLQRPGELLRVR